MCSRFLQLWERPPDFIVVQQKVNCMFLSISLLTDVNPASVQAFHGDVEPLTLLTKPVGHWDGTVLKYHRSSRLRVPAHLEGRRHSGKAMGCYCHLVVSNQHNRDRNLPTSYKINHLFFLFAKTETWGSFLHHQTRDALWSFASSSAHHNIDICVSSSADEGLRGHQGSKHVHTELFTGQNMSTNRFVFTFEPFKM